MKLNATKNNYQKSIYTYLYILLLLFLAILCTAFNKGILFLSINRVHNLLLDNTMPFVTDLGNGLTPLIIILTLICIKKRPLAWQLLASFLLSSAVSFILKRIFNAPRPGSYFSDPSLVHGVSWVPLAHSYSFPSGHTTSAFAIATVLGLSMKNKWGAFMCFGVACLVGYSRIYLGEHFVIDVLFGALIGGLSGYLCVWNGNAGIIKYGFGIEKLLNNNKYDRERSV